METTMKYPQIIGLTGPKNCGKSTIAKYLVTKYGYQVTSFADPVRAMLAVLLPHIKDPDELKDQETKLMVSKWLNCKQVRRGLQTIGTEWGRKCMGKNFWINHWEMRHKKYFDQPDPRVIIDDVRFDNEASFIHGNLTGVVIYLNPGERAGSQDSHASEAGVSDTLIDTTINTERPDPARALAELHQFLERWSS
jgi:hypothetical protein